MTVPQIPPAPGRWATALVVLIAGAMLASWLPPYLGWPWWPDLDAWASIAQGWDRGVRPYRDVVIFNFPGQIYICWLIGKGVGWGGTTPFYAFDAAMLVGLGPLLATWSRGRFGRSLPGLVGWVAALAAYLDLDYSLVAQRDWQGPLLAVAGLLVLQAWPGRGGLVASAAMAAAGFVIRPHVVLFLPAVACVVSLDRESSWRAAIGRGVAWGAMFAVFVVLGFAPLILQGLLGDFLRGVRQAGYGSGYGRVTPSSVVEGVLRQAGLLDLSSAFRSREAFLEHLRGWKALATLVAVAALGAVGPRRVALPWAAALALAFLYEPLHPKRHAYLALPLRLVWAVAFGVLSGLILGRLARRPRAATLAFGLLMIVAVPGVPTYCRPLDSFDALAGRRPSGVPATAEAHFFPGDPNTPYRWEDYRALVAYLRLRTEPETQVANLLRNVPFPAVNGVVGRVSPLPAESGVIWLWSVDPTREGAFVEALARSPSGTVVVWSPGESTFDPRLRLPALLAEARRGFRPEARFGAMEVWRKNSVEKAERGD